MRILTRYVLLDLMQVFVATLTGMTALVFIALIGKEAVDRGLGPGPLLRLMPYILPQAMQFAVPGAMLLATTNVFGRLAACNEVVAIKSMGISPWKIVWPTFALAGAVSLGAVLLNDIAVSWGRMGVERVFVDSLEEVVYGQLRVNRSFTNDRLKITVRRVEGRRLIQPIVTVHSRGGRPPENISAEWAELESHPDRRELVVRFHNWALDGAVRAADPGTYEHAMSLDDLVGAGERKRSPSNYALAEIGPAVRRQRTQVREAQDDMTARAAYAMLTGEFEQLAESSWQPLQAELGAATYTMHRLHTEPYRRWANGFSCLAFVMVGAPVAVLMRKGEFLASFFACFAPILVFYYPLLMVSVDKAKGGALPPPAVWLGNIACGLAGLWLMRRVLRH